METWCRGSDPSGQKSVGIGLMLPGETRRFWVPAALGYGKTRTDGGPAGPLVFDVFLEEAKKDFFR